MTPTDSTGRGRVRLLDVRPPKLLTYLGLGTLTLSYIVIRVHTPTTVYPPGLHDDGLYMKLGASLARGDWLGPFNHFTLMKGPGYPAFLAVAHWLGTPVSLAHALFHSAAVVLFVAMLHRFVRSPLLSALLFVLLLWHPISLSVFLLRVLRDAVYYGQILMFLALFACVLFWPLPAGTRRLYGALSGAVLGWLWLTREEGLVLLPAIVVLVAMAGLRTFHDRRFRQFVGTLAVVIAAFAVPQLGFRAMNWWWYGAFVGVDFNERNFQGALKALHSVRSGEVRAFVSVTRSTRQRIYAVSPAFASLASSLDGPLERAWMPHGCAALPITCGEIGAGWFMWALRDAAAMAGQYASPARSSAFFAQIAREISLACARGALECRPQLIAEMPPQTGEAGVARLPRHLLKVLDLLLFLRPPLEIYHSDDDPYPLAASLRFLNYPLHTRPDVPALFTMHGWYRRSGREWFSGELKHARGMPVALRVDRVASPDIAARFKDADAVAQRFVLRAECTDDCVLRLSTADGAYVEKQLGETRRAPFSVPLGQGTFHVDVADVRPHPMYEQRRVDEWSRRVREWVLRRYELPFMPALVAGAAAFLWSSVVYWRTLAGNVCYVLALASWLLVSVRVLLLALIDATSMPILGFTGYVAPAHFLMVAAAVLSIAGWCQLRAEPAARELPRSAPASPGRDERRGVWGARG